MKILLINNCKYEVGALMSDRVWSSQKENNRSVKFYIIFTVAISKNIFAQVSLIKGEKKGKVIPVLN
jgi:hypothetical protein